MYRRRVAVVLVVCLSVAVLLLHGTEAKVNKEHQKKKPLAQSIRGDDFTFDDEDRTPMLRDEPVESSGDGSSVEDDAVDDNWLNPTFNTAKPIIEVKASSLKPVNPVVTKRPTIRPLYVITPTYNWMSLWPPITNTRRPPIINNRRTNTITNLDTDLIPTDVYVLLIYQLVYPFISLIQHNWISPLYIEFTVFLIFYTGSDVGKSITAVVDIAVLAVVTRSSPTVRLAPCHLHLGIPEIGLPPVRHAPHRFPTSENTAASQRPRAEAYCDLRILSASAAFDFPANHVTVIPRKHI